MSLIGNPKDTPWKSTRYRRWLLHNASCPICGLGLFGEGINYQGHHHRHSGGKRPRDQMIVSLCMNCHNELHANESRFNEKHGMTEEKWITHCIKTLILYADSLNINSSWVAINALREAIQEAE